MPQSSFLEYLSCLVFSGFPGSVGQYLTLMQWKSGSQVASAPRSCDPFCSTVCLSSLGSSSLPCTLSFLIPKRNCWFFNLWLFTGGQLLSSLHVGLLTRSLSKVANLMVCYSAGLLSPTLFSPHAAIEISPSLICRPIVLFFTLHLLEISQLFSMKACFAQCACEMLATYFSCQPSVVKFSGLWFSLGVYTLSDLYTMATEGS